MMPMVVMPMAMPIKTRRKAGSGKAWWTGDVGYWRSTTNAHAEIMYSPNSTPSITYSGQWRRRALSRGWRPTEGSWGLVRTFAGDDATVGYTPMASLVSLDRRV